MKARVIWIEEGFESRPSPVALEVVYKSDFDSALAAIGHLRAALHNLLVERPLQLHPLECRCSYCAGRHALSATSGYGE